MDLPYPKGEEFDPGGLEQLGRRSRVAAVRVAVRYQKNGFRRCWPTELSGEKFGLPDKVALGLTSSLIYFLLDIH